MEQINWGIIGCGDVTEVKSGPAFNKVPNSKLVAVMRRNAQKAEDYALRHGVPKWYTDADKLINDPDVNAIYIATPPLQHEMFCIAALEAGKSVYVEKPMTMDANSAKRMIDAAEKYNTKLSVAHYRRLQPMFLKVKLLLDEKVIGDIRFVNLKMLQPPNPDLIAKSDENWRTNPAISGGGLFHDLAPHQLDLMTYYFGSVEKAQGMAIKQQQNATADDLVAGNILFDSGVLFNGLWCFSVSKEEQADVCEIYGEKGKISFPMFGHKILVSIDNEENTYNFEPLQHVQQPMIAQVVDYFLDKGKNPCSGADALITMKIMDAFTINK
ncbi:Gfo/Idh/MocA family protein [Pedobacter jejuensis]|uniref:Gfo/Idh/MocA family oxidoreductase n=1 Tax=Pedobacter jejuensis TaxID=1268550 RepID=A0A3N0C2L8_9SPHI|nr:Gfo/Idh/MocA family oxidoreductase [Pedobacter jejuensis]RNL56674.1 gfo/Idh/MocA family oxidoreductase [Pedobacter jejuensis]